MSAWLRRVAPSGDALRLVGYFVPLYGAAGISMPFAPVFFESRGLTAVEIGLMMGVGMWLRLGGHVIAGEIADRLGERRRVLVALALGGLAIQLAYVPLHGFWPIASLYVFSTLVVSPLFSLGENAALLTVKGRGLDYGRIRLWGSVSYMIVSFGAGAILVGRSADTVLIMLIVAHAAILAGALMLPDVRTRRGEARGGGALRIVRSPVFWVFLAASGAVQTSHGVYYAFSTLYWREAGLSESTIGFLWSEGIVAEIALFAYATRVTAALSPAMLIAIGGAAGVLRWGLTAATVDPAALAALQLLHALTFCATHLGAMQFMMRAIPDDLSASAQSLHSALAIGAMMGISMTLGGYVFTAWGGAGAFGLMAAFAALGIAMAALLARRWNGERLSV